MDIINNFERQIEDSKKIRIIRGRPSNPTTQTQKPTGDNKK